MASITYQKMRKVYDEGTEAIPGMDLEVPAGMDIAILFQDYALYPHMTVGQNMGSR
jgi:ABC-type sugar transport system ATPase subunit